MDTVNMTGAVAGLANAGVAILELVTDKPGYATLVLGASTLAYGSYLMLSHADEKKKDRNFGDDLGDMFKGALGAAEGGIQLGEFALANWQLILIGGVVVLAGVFLLSAGPTTLVIGGPAPVSRAPLVLGSLAGGLGTGMIFLDAFQMKHAGKPPTFADDPIGTVFHGAGDSISQSADNFVAMGTSEGWEKAGHNMTHPGEYFSKYGKSVSEKWSNVHDFASGFNASTHTIMVLGDMFTL